jgi:hypothetical protein
VMRKITDIFHSLFHAMLMYLSEFRGLILLNTADKIVVQVSKQCANNSATASISRGRHGCSKKGGSGKSSHVLTSPQVSCWKCQDRLK